MQDTLTIPARDVEHERLLGIVFELSPAQASVLSCLVRGTVATADQLLTYTGVRPPIKVVVSRARAKLKERGLFIQSRIGVGYWIENDVRRAIDKAVKDFLERR